MDREEGWAVYELRELVEFADGQSVPSNYREESGVHPFLRVGDISSTYEWGSVWIEKTRCFVSETFWRDRRNIRVAPKGTVVFAKRGEAISLNRKMLTGCEMILGTSIMGLVPNTLLILPKFLLYFMQMQNLYSFASAVTVPAIRKKDLGKLKIALPSLDEQREIVWAINDVRGHLKSIFDRFNRANDRLDALGKRVIEAAFVGELTDSWRLHHFDAEGRDVFLGKMREGCSLKGERKGGRLMSSVDTEGFPEVPSEWRWTTLDELGDSRRGVSRGAKRKPSEELITLPSIGVSNVQDGYLDLESLVGVKVTEREAIVLQLEQGDVLFVEGGEPEKLGRGWVWEFDFDCVYSSHIFCVRLYLQKMAENRDGFVCLGMEPYYLSYFAKTKFARSFFGQKRKQKTGLAFMGLKRFRNLPVPVPGRLEQEEIVSRLNLFFASLDNMQSRVDEGVLRAKSLYLSALRMFYVAEEIEKSAK